MKSMSRFIVCILLCGSFQLFGQGVKDYDHIPDVTYEEMEDRMSCLDSEVPLHFNDKVKAFVDYFTIRDRPYTRDVMGKTQLFFPIFEKTLEKYNLPDELKYLSIVESGLRPNAISRANAVGLWQFVSSTGRMYGLQNDWYLDDRMDPYASTDAAARHLRDLYSMFDDWELALAAYNCGPGNVRKAIRRSGYKKEFWEIYNYLPRETRSYVPQFVAIAYTFNFAAEHNLFPQHHEILPEFDTIKVSQYFHLETFAQQLNVCVDDIISLNPNIKRGAIPEGTKNFALRIPIDVKETVVSSRADIYNMAGSVGREELDYMARNMPGSTYGRIRQVYKVRSGDVLGTIAQKYHVRVSDIQSWNNLSGNMIRVGQNLNLWVMPTYNSSTKDLYTASARDANTVEVKPGQKVLYVKQGDTLWEIAKRADMSIEKLKSLNNLQSNTIQPGQQLIISSE